MTILNDRDRLLVRLRDFLNGLVDGPDKASFAPNARIIENNQLISIGDGLWADATRIGDYQIIAADAETQQAGFMGLIWRGEEASICGIRLGFDGDMIGEVEIIRGPGRFPVSTGVDARTLQQVRPCYTAVTPPAERMSREELLAAAKGYYAAVLQEQPDLAPLDPNGVRIEAGTQINNNPNFAFEFYSHADGKELPNFGLWSAREQFQRGLWNADGVTDERYPLVDSVSGIVFAFTVYRPWHKRGWTEVEGVGRVTPLDNAPRRVALNMLEAFKIEKGMIREMESVWTIEPASFAHVG